MIDSIDSWRKPLFADLLRGIRLASTAYLRPEFRSPWGISIPACGTVFHIIVYGSCLLEMNDLARPLDLSTGDLVLVTRDPHIMCDDRGTPTIDLFDLLKRNPADKNRVFRAGGGGTLTKMVCARVQLEDGVTDPLLAVLPPVIRVRATGEGAHPWLRLTVEQIAAELDSGEAGSDEVANRLADILFIQAVRAYFEENADTTEVGWLAAVRDQRVGRALALLHSQPDQPWTVGSLARRVSVSRSAFADRFTQLIGEPPVHYLTRLRINTAARRLRSTDDKLIAIAADAGYESVAAFIRTFKRYVGMTPGDYRDHPRSGGTAR
jgi:AraC-like DNA-binding protein